MRMYPDKVKKGVGFGYLKFKDFKKFIDENDNIEKIGLASNGEIFLNPELTEIIKYAHKKNVILDAHVGVNLNNLTDEMAETLVKYKFNQITVSIDGATPETYAIYRRGGNFSTVITNIKKINSYKKKYNSEHPKLTYKFILFGHNEHEIDQAKDLAKKLNMEMWFQPNYDKSYSPVNNVELVKEKTGVDSSLSLYEAIGKMYQKNHQSWFFCKELWNYPHINWDGRLIGCCGLPINDFGSNVFKEEFMSALNSPKVLYAKSMISNKAKPEKGIPCVDCYGYSLVKNMNLSLKPTSKNGDSWL